MFAVRTVFAQQTLTPIRDRWRSFCHYADKGRVTRASVNAARRCCRNIYLFRIFFETSILAHRHSDNCGECLIAASHIQ